MPFGIVRSVRKVFPRRTLSKGATEDLVALDDASFEFEAGEIVALLGPSGCGKTTLLRMIAGLIDRSAGEIRIGENAVDGPYADYGFMFQAASLMPWRDVLGNVLYPMEVLGRADAKARNRALELLGLVGLSGFENARPHELSGGMQQRVALCRGLIHSPRLLLMDEPFGALDELTRMEMNDLLLKIRDETGAAILLVTHSISEAVYLADKVLVFSRRPARVIRQIPVSLGEAKSQAARFTPAFMQAERAASEALGILSIPTPVTGVPA